MFRNLFARPVRTSRQARDRRRSSAAVAALSAAAAASLMSLSLAAPAFAHEGEGEVPARDSVLQAIAYVVNTPDDMDVITDKLNDAKDSADQEGVDMADVDKAMQALDQGDMAQVRLLLEESVGAKADLSGLDVRHILQVSPGSSTVSLATGEQTGTLIVSDELPGRGSLTGTDAALIAGAAALAIGGLFLGWRSRPAHSIHTLRRQASHSDGSGDTDPRNGG